MRANSVIMLLSVSAIACAGLSAARAQPALERLERQIRERIGTSEDAPPTVAPPPPQAPPEAAGVEPGYLGVAADDRVDRGRGVRISTVQPGSPADKAGLRRQDLITAVGGIRVRQLADMSEILATFGPGQRLDFDVLRDGKPQQVRVVLGQRPADGERPPPPEGVPLPPGQAIPAPPEPQQAAGPQLQPPKTIGRQSPEASRIERLQRRVDELERRVEELERALKTLRKQ